MKSRLLALALPFAAVFLCGLYAVGRDSAATLTILGNSQAKQCSEHAELVADRKMAPKFAVATCTEALSLEALTAYDRAATFNNRGVVRLGMVDEAVLAMEDFNQAMKADPDVGESYLNRGIVFLRDRRFAEAKAEFEKSLELGVAEPWRAYFNRAVAHEGLSNVRAAYNDYRKALELKPDWEPAALELTRFAVRRR